jgi:hypothetical protein
MIIKFREHSEGKTQPFKKEGIESQSEIPKSNSFRLTSKKLLLTYPNLTISRQEVLNQLYVIFNNNIKEYLICEEINENKNQENSDEIIKPRLIIVYISLNKQVNITTSARLSLIDIDTNKPIVGSYESVKNKYQIINLLRQKDQNHLSNLKYQFVQS